MNARSRSFRSIPGPRTLNLLIFLAATGLIVAALFMQYGLGLEPCYLCIVQRVFVILTGLVALLAWLHNPGLTGRRAYGALTMLTSMGVFFRSVSCGYRVCRKTWYRPAAHRLTIFSARFHC